VYTAELVGDGSSNIDDEGSGALNGNGTSGKSTSGVGGKSTGSVGGSSSKNGGAGSDPISTGGTTGNVAGSAGEDPGTAGTGGSSNPQAGSGSIGGGGSTAGGSGSGGTPVELADLIDGFEDDDLTLEQTAGRGGVWYLFDDGTVGEAGPAPLVCSALTSAPAGLGAYGMHVTATGFTGWGSGLGVDFRAGKKVYDGSQFSGIRFWARVGDGKNTRHRVQLVDGTSDALGGKCDPAVDALVGTKCDDHFGANLIFTSSWAQYSVLFADLTQVGFGNSAPAIDEATLYGLQITAKAKLEVDLWLDQIEFF